MSDQTKPRAARRLFGRPSMVTAIAVAGSVLALGFAGYSYWGAADQRRTAEGCVEAVQAGEEGFARTAELIGLFETKMELAQRMLVTVNEGDQEAVDWLQSRIERIDRHMEKVAKDIGVAEGRMRDHAATCR